MKTTGTTKLYFRTRIVYTCVNYGEYDLIVLSVNQWSNLASLSKLSFVAANTKIRFSTDSMSFINRLPS